MDASFLEVDVAAIRRNYRRLRDLVGPQTRICPVIKGNAYGMGATEVGRVLQQAGASMLAVYDANEALEVLDAGFAAPSWCLVPILAICEDRIFGDIATRGGFISPFMALTIGIAFAVC